MPKRPCIVPRCTEYAIPGGSRCRRHAREFDSERWHAGKTGHRGGAHSPSRKLRNLIYTSQLGRCALCHEHMGPSFDIHHINGDAHDNSPERLVGLHKECHAKVEKEKREKPVQAAETCSHFIASIGTQQKQTAVSRDAGFVEVPRRLS